MRIALILCLLLSFSLDGYCDSKIDLNSNLDPVGKIVLNGKADPTFDSVCNYFPAMQAPRETVGVAEHPIDMSINHLGQLELDYGQPLIAWFKIGDPPVPFGNGKSTIKRRLLNGYLPVVILSMKRNGVDYEQTVFGWSERFSPDKDLYAYIRLRTRAPKGVELPGKVSLVTPDPYEALR